MPFFTAFTDLGWGMKSELEPLARFDPAGEMQRVTARDLFDLA